MTGALDEESLGAISAAIGAAVVVTSARRVGGGCIHEAVAVQLADGGRLFVKLNRVAAAEMFEAEASGLLALGAPGVIRVPRSPRVGVSGGRSCLVMELIEEGRPSADFQARFGALYAEWHWSTRGERFGLERDNFIGSTPQPNGWSADWTTFWRERRLGFQLDLARRHGRSDVELDRLGDRLLSRLEDWLDLADEPACLLHGDLWGGNYLVDSDDAPVLVDPAAYHGHREADLAMTRLFGGFGGEFWSSYHETWPLPPESEDRLAIYELYHLLNHLNLFGATYRSGCLMRLRRLVG